MLDLMPTTRNYGWYLLGAALLIAGAVLWSRRLRPQATEPVPVDEPVSV